MRISDWSSDVCSSDLRSAIRQEEAQGRAPEQRTTGRTADRNRTTRGAAERTVRLLACLLLCVISTTTRAESVDQLDIVRNGDRYAITLHARLDAPLSDSYAVFSDFRNLPKINDAVESIERLPSPAVGVARWRTRVRVCVGFFCTHLKQVQDVRDSHTTERYQLDALVIPALSNLRYGKAHWQLEIGRAHV